MIRTRLLHASHTTSSWVVDHSPVYYGWIVWAIATLGIITTSPAQNFTVSQFLEYLIQDFGVDRTTISTIISIGSLIGAFGLTWVGRKIDQHGNRLSGVMISAGFSITLVLVSFVTSPLMLFIVFTGVRALGTGSLWLVSSTAISQWFIRRRGLTMSVTLVLFALWQTIYVPWLQQALEVHGWREMFILLGIVVGCITLPFTWVLMRNRPEDFGLLPDGVKAQLIAADNNAENDYPSNRKSIIDEENWTLAQAKRTTLFWVFLFGRFIAPMVGSGLVFHQVSLFRGLGHSPEVAAQTYALLSVFNAISALLSGMVVNRVNPKYLLASHMVGFMIALYVAMTMTDTLGLIVYALAVGYVFGGIGVFDGAVWTNLFGRQAQGEIRGFVTMVSILGASVGPILYSMSYDWLGGYTPALWLGIVLCGVSTLMALVVRKPQHPSNVTSMTTRLLSWKSRGKYDGNP